MRASKRWLESLLDEARSRYEAEHAKQRLFGEGLYRAGSWERARRVVYKAEVMEQVRRTAASS